MDKTFLVGFTTHKGQTLASSAWGSSPNIVDLTPSHVDSNEAAFHESGLNSMIFVV